MPYANNDQLPDGVKNVLPADAQTIWRNAFNGAFKKGEEAAMQAGWAAVKNAGYVKGTDGKWIKSSSQKDTGMMHSLDVEIMSVGIWNNIPFSLTDLQTMAKNFEELKGVIKPPIKLGHRRDETGLPALGWVSGLKVVGQKLLATVSDIPEKLFNAIKSKAYRRVSLEMFNNFEYQGKKHGRVLSALAFLGAEIPAVKDLEDLQAYLTQNSKAWTFESVAVFTSDFNYNSNENEGGLDMPTVEELSAKIDQLTQTMATFSQENTALKKKVDDLTTENAGLKKNLKEKTDNEVKEFKEKTKSGLKAFCDEAVKQGKMLPAQRDLLFKEDSPLVVFTDSGDAYVISADNFKKFVEAGGKMLEKKQQSNNDDKRKKDFKGTVDDNIHQLTLEYMTEHKIENYEVALHKVIAANPELADKFTDENYQASGDSDDD